MAFQPRGVHVRNPLISSVIHSGVSELFGISVAFRAQSGETAAMDAAKERFPLGE